MEPRIRVNSNPSQNMQPDERSYLRRSLFANVLFSALSGCVLLLGSSPLQSYFGFDQPLVLPVIGICLLGFASGVIIVALKLPQTIRFVPVITLLDWLWVAGSIIIVSARFFNLSAGGYTVIAAVATVVGTLAFFQRKYLKKYESN